MECNPRHEVDHAGMKSIFFPTPDLETVCIRQVEGEDDDEMQDLIYVPLPDIEEFLRALRLTVKKTRELRRRRKNIKSRRDYDQ